MEGGLNNDLMSVQSKKDNYHILSLIGQGAYGHVYKARRKFTGQFVAIKSIKKKGKEEKDIKVMRDEIEILKKLKHENIVLLLDSFETQAEFILVTELGQGELFNIIEDDQSLQEAEIRTIAQQLVRALHYIHSNRITHRDMKPQNILMTSDGVIKLCDFGFARHMSYKTEVLTSLKGTPLYMAPEVVKEEPYNHTADLWSLGVILYELATGTPPFTAPNLITLVQHISKDPISYPDFIAGDFRSFLKGLLNKDPRKRLGWPDLLAHPFIKETEAEKQERKRKTERFSNWVEDNHYSNQEEEPAMGGTIYARSVSQAGFEERSRDISPRKETVSCGDAQWGKFLALAAEEKGATQLRSDPAFLDALLRVLETNLNEIMRVKEKRSTLGVALRVLTQVLMKSRPPESRKFDNTRNLNIPNHLLTLLKGLLKVEGGKGFLETISDITKLVGLLAKASFHKNFGIEMVYVRSFVPLMPLLVRAAVQSSDPAHQAFATSLLRTTGIFANNASANHIRSFSFYKDLVEKRFIQECMEIGKVFEEAGGVLRLFVQVLSAFMHPVYGDIECFPWQRDSSAGVQEFKECATMLECVRQTVINSLLEARCGQLFAKVLALQEENALLPKISVCRITLQAIRQSKEFTEYLLFQEKNVLKHVLLALGSPDQVVYATACQILSQLARYCREKKREKQLEPHLVPCLPILLARLRQSSKGVLSSFGSLVVLQQLVSIEGNAYFTRIAEQMQDKGCLKALVEFMSGSQTNKLEEMRKIEGSNYGIHSIGLYDPLFLFLHRLILRLQREQPRKHEQFIRNLRESKLQIRVSSLLVGLSSKTDLSPRGLISLLMLLYDLLSTAIWDEFADEQFLGALVGLLKETQVEGLVEWPVTLGGGEVCVTTMFGNLMKIFLAYLQEAEKEPQILRVMHAQKLLELVVGFTRFLSGETIGSVVTFILHLMSFDKEGRDKENRSFVKQFIQANGMSLFVRFQLLRSQQATASLIESCNLLSQIARHSKEVYEYIDSVEPYQDLKKLASHSDPQVRSRVLNLIGNMCRHSGFFYKKLAAYGILKLCISLCEDEDKTIKKFACVAIGNASFHDDSLYDALRPAIPVLVALLKDAEEKTRSNAAAALGNLARNSALLDKDFLNTGANYQLVNMLATDKSPAAKKVSIMAILNLLELPESKKVLLTLDIAKVLQRMLVPPLSSDSGLVKTAQKALEKLK